MLRCRSYLLSIIDNLPIKEILHQRCASLEYHVIFRSTIHGTPSNGVRTDVGMTVKRELKSLGFLWMKSAIER